MRRPPWSSLGPGKRSKRLLFVLLLLLCAAFFLPPLPEEYKDLRAHGSLVLQDRNGQPLRRNLSSRDGVNTWLPLSEIPEELQVAVLQAEDSRFPYHPGVDPVAILRAARDNWRAGQVVSGASTITQQTLRTLSPGGERSLSAKLREAYWALRLEWRYSKDELLEAYLNRVAFGPSVYGVAEASRYYFDKPVGALSTAEVATLAVVIRSPSALDPFARGGNEELSRWTAQLLNRLVESGELRLETAERAKAQPLELSPKAPPFAAPHFCDLVQRLPLQLRGEVKTSLDLHLQETVEGYVRTHLALLAEHNVRNAAVVVAEVETGEILALAGSADFQKSRDGQHNAAVSLRQPGSTIKPFTYALLLERTGHAGFILPDLDLYEQADEESYIPKNYDNHFHGPVSIRTALACSYNVPAVRALERVGVNNLLELLQRGGFTDLDNPPEHYGLGLTLGNGSSSLLQLVSAFRVLARGGLADSLTYLHDKTPRSSPRLLDPRVCYQITDILDDDTARIPSFGTPNSLEMPFPCAVKTGTSKGYRDNWAIGYTPKHIVGVWVGNSDGSPMRDVSGITGAGPLFRDVMLTLGTGGDFPSPEGLVSRRFCSLSGQGAGPNCPNSIEEVSLEEVRPEPCEVCLKDEKDRTVFALPTLYQGWAEERGIPLVAERESMSTKEQLRFIFPLDEDIFLTDPDLKSQFQRVRFRIAGGTAPFQWQVEGGRSVSTEEREHWWQLVPGFHSVKVVDSRGAEASIQVQVLGRDAPG